MTAPTEPASPAPPFVLVGHPENRRTALFGQALARLGLPAATVLAYDDLLAGRADLAAALRPGSVLRLDSPGENFGVEKALLAAGAAEAEAEGAPFLPPDRLAGLSLDRGLLLHPRQWYLGFRATLRAWGRQVAPVPGVRLLSAPADVEVMFDKRLCHAACARGGVRIPDALGPAASFDELVARLEAADWRQAFVKLAHGSSASGVVALRRHGGRLEAITSAELVRAGEVRLYNSLRRCRYTRLEDVRDLLEALCREGVHVERWLPKASLAAGTVMDVRVVVIAGQARHFVVRQGPGPMTNLHLGNRRGDAAALLARLGPAGWEAVCRTCERAAGLFRGSLCVGVDVALSPDFAAHAVLEVNAFGDLLPGVLWQGLDTYAAQVAAVLRS
jgi:hypothetical protein